MTKISRSSTGGRNIVLCFNGFRLPAATWIVLIRLGRRKKKNEQVSPWGEHYVWMILGSGNEEGYLDRSLGNFDDGRAIQFIFSRDLDYPGPKAPILNLNLNWSTTALQLYSNRKRGSDQENISLTSASLAGSLSIQNSASPMQRLEVIFGCNLLHRALLILRWKAFLASISSYLEVVLVCCFKKFILEWSLCSGLGLPLDLCDFCVVSCVWQLNSFVWQPRA